MLLKCKKVADYFNDRYGTLFTVEDIKKAINVDEDGDLLREVEEDTYTDTYPRERFLDIIAMNRIGMHWPCNMGDEAYITEFKLKGIKNGMLTGELEYIKKENLKPGHAYYCDGRNFAIGIWDGECFHYLRTKFGLTYMDTEYHYDNGPPHGTVKPLRELK